MRRDAFILFGQLAIAGACFVQGRWVIGTGALLILWAVMKKVEDYDAQIAKLKARDTAEQTPSETTSTVSAE